VFAYGHRQRLTSVISYTAANVKTKEVRYEYDGLNRRFRRRLDNNGDGDFVDSGDVRERLLYDTNAVTNGFAALSPLPRLGGEGQGEGAFASTFHELVQTISETTAGVPDTTKRKHRFLNGPQPDMVLVDEVFNTSGTPTDILWLLQDHQNTVTDVATMSSTSGQGTLRNHLEYNAFGEITSQTNSTYAPLQTYTGQILDPTTGLLFYDARWYDPTLARFVSADPIGFAAGDANLTRYVGNSFANAVDPARLDADRNGVPSPEAQARQ
jgi:RHS repeat-associated protein